MLNVKTRLAINNSSKNIVARLLLGVVICCVTAACQREGTTAVTHISPLITTADLLVTGAVVIDVHTGSKQHQDIYLKDDKIVALHSVGTSSQRSMAKITAQKTIDARGTFAIPGLWDMHVHLTQEPELVDHVSALFMANGVTSVRDLGAVLDDIKALKQREQQNTFAPAIWFAGPILDGWPTFDGIHNKPAMSLVLNTPDDAVRWVDALVDNGAKVIKVYILLRPEVLRAVVKRAHHHKLKVTGHIPLLVTALEGLEIGMDGMEHMGAIQFDCTPTPKLWRDKISSVLEAHNYNYHASINDLLPLVKAIRLSYGDLDSPHCLELIQAFARYKTWVTPTLSTYPNHFSLRLREFHWDEDTRYLPVSYREKWKKRHNTQKNILTDPQTDQYKIRMGLSSSAYHYVKQLHDAGAKLLAGTVYPRPNETL